MALQSQVNRTSRSAVSTRTGTRDKASARRLMGIVFLVILLGGGFVYLAQKRGISGPQPANAGVTLPVSNAPAASESSPAPQPAASVVPTPATLEMSGGQRPGSSSRASDQPAAPVIQPAQPATVRDPLATTPQQASPTPSVVPAGPLSASNLPGELAAVLQLADKAMADKNLVAARAHYNKLLVDARVSDADRATLRATLGGINQQLVFSSTVHQNDPMAESYKVERGDSLIRISRKLNTVTEAHMIERVNALPNANSLRVGQALKIIRGPFHAVVSRSAFRMDVYWGPAPSPSSIGTSNLAGGAEPGWVYITSFPVGLGEKGTTPMATFTVRDSSKLINPPWVNPRTGEKFAADDAKNPIGEHWVGLVGIDDKSKQFTGYGIHGTIDPQSIGREMSMGCVRMNAADVEQVYELLMPRVSVVKVVP